ncbi:MAG: hypothetical protein QM737_09870 [Ferruginibacter sp.]
MSKSRNSIIIGNDIVEHAYKIAAKVISLKGELYLPVFERLHSEKEKIENKISAKNIALKVAAMYDQK